MIDMSFHQNNGKGDVSVLIGSVVVGKIHVREMGKVIWFLFPGDNNNSKVGHADNLEAAKSDLCKAFMLWLQRAGLNLEDVISEGPTFSSDIWRILNAHGIGFRKGRGEVSVTHRGGSFPVVVGQNDEVEVSSLADLSACITARRIEVRATSEMVDMAAGLTSRQVQKIEDAGRRFAEGKKTTKNDMAALMLRFSQTGMTEEIAHTLQSVANGAIRDIEYGTDRRVIPRVPTFDTALLAVQALGGRLSIQWGAVPAIMRSMLPNNHR